MHRIIAELERRLGVRPHQYLVVSSAKRHDTAKAVLYAFAPGGRRPAFVVKIPYAEGTRAHLRDAFDNLGRLGALLAGSPLAGSVPRPLLFAELEGRTVCAESFVPGRLLSSLRGRRARWAGCRTVFGWLATLARLTRRAESPTAPAAEPPAHLRGYVGSVLGRLEGEARLGAVFAHNDLSLHNVVMTGARVALIDWELASPYGWPLVDGVDFALSTIMTATGEDLGAAFQRFLAPADRLGRPIRAELGRLARASGVHSDWIEPLVVRFLLNELAHTAARAAGAVRSLERLAADGFAPVRAEVAA